MGSFERQTVAIQHSLAIRQQLDDTLQGSGTDDAIIRRVIDHIRFLPPAQACVSRE
jgi:hypothetical protein